MKIKCRDVKRKCTPQYDFPTLIHEFAAEALPISEASPCAIWFHQYFAALFNVYLNPVIAPEGRSLIRNPGS